MVLKLINTEDNTLIRTYHFENDYDYMWIQQHQQLRDIDYIFQIHLQSSMSTEADNPMEGV